MEEQRGLFDDEAPRIPRALTPEERFLAFHKAHPEVYAELALLTRKAIEARGGDRVGIRMVWERMRWTFYVDRDRGEEFRLNNNYTSRYARLLMAREPDLAGVFETREREAA